MWVSLTKTVHNGNPQWILEILVWFSSRLHFSHQFSDMLLSVGLIVSVWLPYVQWQFSRHLLVMEDYFSMLYQISSRVFTQTDNSAWKVFTAPRYYYPHTLHFIYQRNFMVISWRLTGTCTSWHALNLWQVLQYAEWCPDKSWYSYVSRWIGDYVAGYCRFSVRTIVCNNADVTKGIPKNASNSAMFKTYSS